MKRLAALFHVARVKRLSHYTPRNKLFDPQHVRLKVGSQSNFPSRSPHLKLLALSNGHGEDEVAVRVLRQLQHQCPDLHLQAMPIVGEGQAYQQAGIELYGPTQTVLPSGGFIYMDNQRIIKDLKAGLLTLTRKQLQALKAWKTQQSIILAVGDIVPLAFAYWSRTPFTFIGTAKSEYYLHPNHTPDLPIPRSPWPWHRWLNCVYHPWERWLMQSSHCKAVFPRDRLTAEILHQWPIPVLDLGNPMLDDLEPQGKLPRSLNLDSSPLTISLLPGSRPPEAYENWSLILAGIAALTQQNILFLGAIASLLDLDRLSEIAHHWGWQQCSSPNPEISVPHRYLKAQSATLLVVQHSFNDCLAWADMAIAMAGTATEQCVGLGKPVITIPGNGPQFTWVFAEAQSRLLGQSIHFLDSPQAIAPKVLQLQQQDQEQYHVNGRQRMGTRGAAHRIATQLLDICCTE
jgi:uncharacterized protein (TIGR03492 family)